jgi:hypothetical protein
MNLFNLYIYNRDGKCIYYREWNRTKSSGLSKEQVKFKYLNKKIYI